MGEGGEPLCVWEADRQAICPRAEAATTESKIVPAGAQREVVGWRPGFNLNRAAVLLVSIRSPPACGAWRHTVLGHFYLLLFFFLELLLFFI